MTINVIFQNFKVNFNPTHKRIEGRAPVWGSEFTSKDATLKGGSRINCCYAKSEIVGSGGGGGGCGGD
jgi:hypothetical protein